MDYLKNEIYRKKIKTSEELLKIVGPHPRKKKIAMCHGTFDVVHPGHIRHLYFVKDKTDILVASLTCDEHISKANYRPFVPEDLRAMNLASLEMVDYVIIDRGATPLSNIKTIRPDYYAKGYEYSSEGIHPKTQEEMKVLESYGGEIIFTPGDIVYSSSNIIENSPPKIAAEKLLSVMDSENISFTALEEALVSFEGLNVHVIGDTIVDSYCYCDPIGHSSKTPTLSVRQLEEKDYVGGAAIVAKHLVAAGANVAFSTVMGEDKLKDYVLEDLKKAGVACTPIIDKGRPTTQKKAFIANGYRLLKVDKVDNRIISSNVLGQLCDQLASNIKADVVIFSDFRHGLFGKETIPTLIKNIPEKAIKVADSQVASRWGNILEFNGFDLITPNEKEARFSLGDQDSVVRPLATKLYQEADCRFLILKLGANGILSVRNRPEEDPRRFFMVDSFAEKVVDSVGTGDALLAYASLGLAKTGNEVVATILGALSASIACEQEGNIPVDAKKVLDKLKNMQREVRFN